MLLLRVPNNAALRHCIGCNRPRLVPRQFPIRRLHDQDWQNRNAINEQNRKFIPKLVYLQHPWNYLKTKFSLWKLKLFWDRSFSEGDFIEGSKQAAIVMTDIIREQTADRLAKFTTPVGFQQITRDMFVSREDTRLQLVRFEAEHLRRAIPMRVATRQNFGRSYAFIDMLFVGLRNTKDFDSRDELQEISKILRRMDLEVKTPAQHVSMPHRIVFAEIFIRFRRDYTAEWQRKEESQHKEVMHRLEELEDPSEMTLHKMLSHINDPGWSVSFYKFLTFKVLGYDPK